MIRFVPLVLLAAVACAGPGGARERAAMPPRSASLGGVVAEQHDTPEYSYLRLNGVDGENWVVVARHTPLTGRAITVRDAVLVTAFKSAALARTFERLFFAVLDEAGAPASAPIAAQGHLLSGVVKEILRANPYMYLRLAIDGGETWAAVPSADLALEMRVAIANPSNMDGFASTSLKRTFDKIVFGVLAVESTPSAVAPASQPGFVERPFNALVTAKDLGEGTRVRVRAKVIKRTPGVMGKNWFHVVAPNGEGTPLVVVSIEDDAAIGAIVDIEGVWRMLVDLGFGYRYDRLVDDARLVKAQ